MVREKIVAAASKRRFFLVGAEKCVKRLGERGRLPVEVLPLAVNHVIRAIAQLGIRAAVRRSETGGEVLTDNGNSIVDCAVSAIRNPARLESGLLAIPGVVGTGLFLGFADVVLVASRGEITVVRSRADHRA
jgi:ribose 5-phosphate isomerase A